MKILTAPVGISNRHIHLSHAHIALLFGDKVALTIKKELYQPGQYAMEECVTLVGPKGSLNRVRVLGPARAQTQVEISRTDCFHLGIPCCVRQSGDLKGSPGLQVIGPAGSLQLTEGAIVAARHLHLAATEADEAGLHDGDRISVRLAGERGLVLENVLVRISPEFRRELHIDTDEANAAAIENSSEATLMYS